MIEVELGRAEKKAAETWRTGRKKGSRAIWRKKPLYEPSPGWQGLRFSNVSSWVNAEIIGWNERQWRFFVL